MGERAEKARSFYMEKLMRNILKSTINIAQGIEK